MNKMVGKKVLIILGAAVSILIAAAVAWRLVDPLERVRQARDRRLETSAEEFLTVAENYFKQFFEYPWDVLALPRPSEESVRSAWLQEFVREGLVDAGFASRPHWDQIFITQDGGTISACFAPQSKEFKERADLLGRWKSGVTGCAEGCFACVSRGQ